MKLGKIKRITDLRSIWPHEANDFTKWLADEHNLAKLGEEIGIELELEERESSVGNFNVDLYAKEENCRANAQRAQRVLHGVSQRRPHFPQLY